jgi:amino-acid N-acetyltransferase
MSTQGDEATRSPLAAPDGIEIALATDADVPAVRALLSGLELPVEDLGAPNQRFLVARKGGAVVGCVAVEQYGTAALLRSFAVRPAQQGSGVGRALFEALLAEARRRGVEDAYLLTTTIESFAARRGFARVDRGAVPAAVRASAEFRTCCPATAVCMGRRL